MGSKKASFALDRTIPGGMVPSKRMIFELSKEFFKEMSDLGIQRVYWLFLKKIKELGSDHTVLLELNVTHFSPMSNRRKS